MFKIEASAKIHDLKILSDFYKPVVSRKKSFEIRKNDRNFRVGDYIILREFHINRLTGRVAIGVITYITNYEQKEGYVVFAFELLSCEG